MFHLPHMSFILFYFILGWGGGGFQWLLESGGKNMG